LTECKGVCAVKAAPKLASNCCFCASLVLQEPSAPSLTMTASQQQYELAKSSVQQAFDTAKASLRPGAVLERAHVALLGDMTLLALMKRACSRSTAAAVTPGAVDRQARAVRTGAETVARLVLDRLNADNSLPGLDWTSLPHCMSLSLSQHSLDRGYIRADGEPVLRQQPSGPFRVSLPVFLVIERRRSIIGRIDEVWGSSDMIVVPDWWPWVHRDQMAEMIIALVLPVTRCSTGAYNAWLCQLFKRFPKAHTGQWVARMVVSGVVRCVRTNATAAVPVLAAGTCSASHGGSGSSGLRTAVGGDGEGQGQLAISELLVPAHSQEGEAADTAAAVASSSSRSRVRRVWGATVGRVGSLVGRALSKR
jgi:hypothetical protein